MKIIDINKWNRKEHFEFFSKFDEPYYGITAEVECTAAYKNAKETGIPFFIYYLHKSNCAINGIENLKLRIVDEQVVLYEVVHASSTIGREDNTFAYSFIKHDDDINIFYENAKKEIEAVKNSTGLRLNDEAKRFDTVHYSPVPWIKFTSVTHARDFKRNDSVPKISFGKMTESNGKLTMPVGIYVHHGLVDGYHVGRYFELFQEFLNGTI